MPSSTRFTSLWSCSTGISASSPRAARSTRRSPYAPGDTLGRLFYELADGQWSIPALRKLLEEVIPQHRIVEAYEIEHDFASMGRRTLLLNARQVFDEANPNSALLLAIEDVTARRAAEREKDECYARRRCC